MTYSLPCDFEPMDIASDRLPDLKRATSAGDQYRLETTIPRDRLPGAEKIIEAVDRSHVSQENWMLFLDDMRKSLPTLGTSKEISLGAAESTQLLARAPDQGVQNRISAKCPRGFLESADSSQNSAASVRSPGLELEDKLEHQRRWLYEG